MPSFIYPNDYNRDNLYLNSAVNVLKGAHIRLQYINLSYSPLLKLRNKTAFKGIELYANAANLGIIWRANKEHIDPDYPTSIAPAKIWAVGVRCNF